MASSAQTELPSWETMFKTAVKNPKTFGDSGPATEPSSSVTTPTNSFQRSQSNRFQASSVIGQPHLSSSVASANLQLAIYIALAHAGLICCGAILVGLFFLLGNFWEPILWAILCSMPLRKVQDSLVAFWEPSLKAGLLSTFLAPFRALLQAVAGTLYDGLAFASGLVGVRFSKRDTKGFERLSQWLATFAVFNLTVDGIGLVESLLFAPVCLLLYRQFQETSGSSDSKLGKGQKLEEDDGASDLLTKKPKSGGVISLILGPYRALDRYICSSFLGRLRPVTALLIISTLCVGSLFTTVFFTYQIAMEGKEAVVAVDHHVRSSNYLEKVGVTQWLNENNVSKLVDTYSATALKSISEQIDIYSEKYEMVEAGDAIKTYLNHYSQRAKGLSTLNGTSTVGSTGISSLIQVPQFRPLIQTANLVKAKALSYDFKGAYQELQEGAFSILEKYNISREGATLQFKTLYNSTEKYLGKFLTSSSTLLTKTASASSAIVKSVSEGAKDVIDFLASVVFFVSLLYYFITSEAGGVLQQVLDLFPFSAGTKIKCETAIGDAISGVLMSVMELALFESIFTFLLLWFFNIHFLYLSTTFAVFSGAFPILPSWLCLFPGVVQLALTSRYIEIIPMVLIHQVGNSYANDEIMKEIPGHNPYLIGLSIAGSTALFNSVFKGAIFGPLMVTILIALRRLHSEFLTSITVE